MSPCLTRCRAPQQFPLKLEPAIRECIKWLEFGMRGMGRPEVSEQLYFSGSQMELARAAVASALRSSTSAWKASDTTSSLGRNRASPPRTSRPRRTTRSGGAEAVKRSRRQRGGRGRAEEEDEEEESDY